MTQAAAWPIPTPAPGDGTMDQLDDIHNALATLHRGAAQPDYFNPVGGPELVGAMWIDNAGGDTAELLKLYTGSDASITLATINRTSGAVVWSNAIAATALDTDGALAANSDAKVASQKAVKTYVDGIVAAQDAMVFKGVIDCSANPNYPAADRGHTYRVSVAGKIGGASGVNVEAGDLIICITDSTVSGNQATVGANWAVIQANIDGAVIGDLGANDNRLLRSNGTGGQTAQGSDVTLDDNDDLSGMRHIAMSGYAELDEIASPANPAANKLRVFAKDVGGVTHLLTRDSAGTETDLSTASGTATRELLTANRTYYVRTDGSDSNDGLTNSAGGAFLTKQKAVDVAAALDLSIYDVTIQVGNGTYTGAVTLKSTVGAGTVTIKGDETTPSNVLISVTSADAFTANGVRGTWKITGVKTVTTTSGGHYSITNSPAIQIGVVEFGASAAHHVYVTGSTGAVKFLNNYTISGNATYHWLLSAGGTLVCESKTVTLSGTPAFSSAFVNAARGALAEVSSNTFSGSATGSRYDVRNGGIIYTGAAGTSYFPGNAAGNGTNFGASPYGLYA